MNAVPKPPKKTKVSRPTRDEFELQELAEKLMIAKESSEQLVISIWRCEEIVNGVVAKMDPSTQSVHIRDRMGDVIKVPFIDIIRAERPAL